MYRYFHPEYLYMKCFVESCRSVSDENKYLSTIVEMLQKNYKFITNLLNISNILATMHTKPMFMLLLNY